MKMSFKTGHDSESNGGKLVKTYSRVGRAKDLKTSKYTINRCGGH